MLNESQKILLKEEGPNAVYLDLINGGIDDVSAIKMLYGEEFKGGKIFYFDKETKDVKLVDLVDQPKLYPWYRAIDTYNNGWNLPSRSDFHLMWKNLADSDENGINYGPEDIGNLGGFQAALYVSREFHDPIYKGLHFDFGKGQIKKLGAFQLGTKCLVRLVLHWYSQNIEGLSIREIQRKLDNKITPLSIFKELRNHGNVKYQALNGLCGRGYQGGIIYDVDENTGIVKLAEYDDAPSKYTWDKAHEYAQENNQFNWQLPTVEELSLMRKNLAYSGELKPDMYWSTIDQNNNSNAHAFNINNAESLSSPKDQKYYVRLVRIIDPENIPSVGHSGIQEKLSSGNETPSSIFNSLVAEGKSEDQALKELYGKEYEGGLIFKLDKNTEIVTLAALQDGPNKMTWDKAKIYTENYEYGDWSLPTVDDLTLMWKNLADSDGNGTNSGPKSLGNLGRFKTGPYWGTGDPINITGAYICYFSDGLIWEAFKNQKYYVRPIRVFDPNESLVISHAEIQGLLTDKNNLMSPLAVYEWLLLKGKTEDQALSMLYGKEYQGGHIFYLNTSTGTGLIAAPADLGIKLEWGSMSKNILTSDGLEQGSNNTKNIVNAAPVASDAAAICSTLKTWFPGKMKWEDRIFTEAEKLILMEGGTFAVTGKYTGHREDWFLPSISELKKMHKNLFLKGHSNFQKVTEDGEIMYYWSSTGIDSGGADSAFCISFDGLDPDLAAHVYRRDNLLWVRPVRAF